MGKMTQEEINVELFDEIKRLKEERKHMENILVSSDYSDEDKLQLINSIFFNQ